MTDNDIMINGVNDVPSEFDDFMSKKSGATATDDDGSRVFHLNHRIEELEREKREGEEGMKRMEAEIEDLMKENAAMQEQIDELKKAEVEKSESESKALESIAKRAMELETEVARLQHDLITSMNAEEEANQEIEELRREIDGLKREKAALEADSERKISELERKNEELQEKGRVAESEKAKAEQNANARMDETEGEIVRLRREKKEVEESVSVLKAQLKKSDEKVKEMEAKLTQLMEKSEESDKMISGVMEKAAARDGVDGLVGRNKFGGFRGLKVQLPVAGAASAAVVLAAVSVYYIRYSRTR
ncbi:hypothetical protein Ancab_023881 [Ancistrocladus abbreviatus]